MRRASMWWPAGTALTVVVAVLLVGGRSGSDAPATGETPTAPSTGRDASSPSDTATSTPDTAVDAPPTDDGPLRAFAADSWWNTPVPAHAPTHPDAAAILEYMSTAPESNGGCISLAGAENSWGQPVYWADSGDPEYDVNVPKVDEPPEFSSLRIPEGARAADTSDDAMTIFDLERGYVVALTGAHYNDAKGIWRAHGATVTYLASNGLHARTGESDDSRNLGNHRGNNGATMMVRYDEFAAGKIEHVLKVASGPEMSDRAVFPMIGSDGDSADDPIAPKQGLRFRLKPSVDLDSMDLHPEARLITEALQTHGFYLGDSSGATALKLENTRAEGKGQQWTVPASGLCDLPLDPEFWDVLPEGYDPS